MEDNEGKVNGSPIDTTCVIQVNGVPVFSNDLSQKVDIGAHNLEVASLIVEDARKGKMINFKTDPDSVRYYKLYRSRWFRYLTSFVLLILFLLIFFESPAPKAVLPPFGVTISIEVVCIVYFLMRMWINLNFAEWNIWKKDIKHWGLLVCLCLTLLDIMIQVILQALNIPYVRWSRFLRPLVYLNTPEQRQVRRIFRNIRRTLIRIAPTLVLIVIGVAIGALLAFKLFVRKKFTYLDGRPFFQSYPEAFWDLWVLTTTANSPDVMIPAYAVNNLYALFYIPFFTLISLIFLPILLAITMDNYKTNLRADVTQKVLDKRKSMEQAFTLISEDRDGERVLTKEVWTALVRCMFPGRSSVQIDLLFCVLEGGSKDYLTLRQFYGCADLLNVKVTEVKDRLNLFDMCCPSIYDSTASLWLRSKVEHKWFQFAFYLLIVVNAVCILMSLDNYEWIFLGLFSLEIMLKIYAKGCKKFFQGKWNLFDFFVIFGALILNIFFQQVQNKQFDVFVDILMTLRVIRLVKFARSLKSFNVVIKTILSIMPSILTYGTMLWCLYYEYALLGMELFSGLVKSQGAPNVTDCGNPALSGSDFAKAAYCEVNFNDASHSFVTLFVLMVVNQWHILTAGFSAVTSKWARVYFISFNLTCLVVLNIFIAFVVEVFLVEYQLSKSKMETAIEMKIKEMGLDHKSRPRSTAVSANSSFVLEEELPEDGRVERGPSKDLGKVTMKKGRTTPNSEGVCFHLTKRSAKPVEVVLQSLFEENVNLDSGSVPLPSQLLSSPSL